MEQRETKVIITCEVNNFNDHVQEGNDNKIILNSANEISKVLTDQFHIQNITISISSMSTISSNSSSLLVENDNNDSNKIYLVVSNNDRSTSGLISYIEDNTYYPVLSFNIHKYNQDKNLQSEYNKCALRVAKIYGLNNKSIQVMIQNYLNDQKQKIFINNIQIRTQFSPYYKHKISNCLMNETYVQGIDKSAFTNDDTITLIKGKVREQISSSKAKATNDKLILVTTDRQSG